MYPEFQYSNEMSENRPAYSFFDHEAIRYIALRHRSSKIALIFPAQQLADAEKPEDGSITVRGVPPTDYPSVLPYSSARETLLVEP